MDQDNEVDLRQGSRRARSPRRRRRRRWVGAALLATSLLGLVVAVGPRVVRRAVDAVRDDLVAARPTAPATGDPVPLAPAADQVGSARWTNLPPLPIGEREGIAWAAGDRFLIAWGGAERDRPTAPMADGAVFDTASST